MTVHRSARLVVLALVSASLLVAGCSRPGASPADSPSVTIAAASVEPSETAVPSGAPTTEASPSDSLVPETPMAEPPGASIAVEGGDPVVGVLGSFTWQNSGSDGPWLEGSPIHLGLGERLTLTLAEPVAVANWTASRIVPGDPDGSVPVGLGEATGGPVSFGAPPQGTWSVQVSVWFADNLGSAAYYWLMEVD